mmetsp:Transcript_26844/g.41633  ORF Transcript_26844/g.41633 Transcript_26844/m.41633 type:complete len:703 (+) Transcript_26844:97-2205(+)|eukprot:CAMPEP_0196822318 /NCGR_PEP_ID=MMETSP1362-20130617/82971_1 /TAXON_ID=163516 /ORGANISM="Leptocylindrus danicus, Strain CCMP1856" /LENGTH=702 /DNA_ID=CAMNT_0042201843 /DNA_START=18 /DNA_END=2126 /DNA_ORIENTATION=-
MPVYICRSGQNKHEPWRHGMEVYITPFDREDCVPASTAVADAAPGEPSANTKLAHIKLPPKGSVAGLVVRRVRHAEVVLVDEVVEECNHYWLKLRWPGASSAEGGFAGYIDLGTVKDVTDEQMHERRMTNVNTEPELPPLLCASTDKYFPSTKIVSLLRMYDDGLNLTTTAPSSTEANFATTGNATNQAAENTDVEDEEADELEPVFCRICREVFHDVNYDVAVPGPFSEQQKAPADQNASTDILNNNNMEPTISTTTDGNGNSTSTTIQEIYNDHTSRAQILAKQFASHPLSENPFLAPCECSGSMAFVHRLCVEEWRCRSRHPAARNGLNCETCGGAYTLPPPPLRTDMHANNVNANANIHMFADDDWVDAMPAHVLAALRRPHPWWQICAAIVRRKWLRPLAPIVCSPIVATYCRCRRLLKKRGVSRRRWACSLCRRRARWKCVRCLRSYYCSRQCQNVSWHIMHKHMCYKPARVWWSSVFYATLTIIMFPGIWQNPLIYWTAILQFWEGFFVASNLGGSVATVMKKIFRVDLRGRFLESAVVLITFFVGSMKWGIIWGFFGRPDYCLGALNIPFKSHESLHSPILKVFRQCLLTPIASLLQGYDSLFVRYGRKNIMCSPTTLEESDGLKCFETPNAANPWFLEEPEGQACASDNHILLCIYAVSFAVMALAFVLKKTDRRGGRAGRRAAAAGARPHQD